MSTMKVEDVLEKIGDFGLYQKRTFFLSSLCMSLMAVNILLSVFIAGVPKHRCRDDTTDIHTYTSEPHNRSINVSACGVFDKSCHVCSTDQTSGELVLKKCDNWIYDNSIFESTVITEFDLVCGQEVMSTHVTTAFMAGAFVGSLFSGIIADTFGRRKTLLVSVFLQLICNFTMVFAPGYSTYAITRALFGLISTGSTLTMGMIPVEMVGPKWRNPVLMGSELFFPGGMLFLLLAAYFIRNWRMLVLAVTCPFVLVFLLYLRYIPESMRWLISKKRYEEAQSAMVDIAKVNQTLENIELLNLKEIEIQRQEKAHFRMLFSSKIFIIRSLAVGCFSCALSMAYYGVNLNIGNLSGDLYINFLFVSLAEVPGYVFAYLTLDKLGRRKSLVLDMFLGGLSCFGIIIPILTDEKEMYPLTLTFIGIGKFGLAAAFGVSYLYIVEMFPTSFRNTFLGYGAACLRFGAIICTYIADSALYIEGNVGRTIPLILFGGLSCLAGLVVLVLPETAGITMPESFEESMNLTLNVVKSEKGISDEKRKALDED